MGKFKFKLQPLLNIKLQMEDSLKNELGKAVQKLENEKNVLRHIVEEIEACIKQINIKSVSGITVDNLRGYNNYKSLLRDKSIKQKENINYAQQYVDKCREDLLKVVQEREMLDKLKEKKYQEFIVEQLKDEQKTNDEIISFNYSKQN